MRYDDVVANLKQLRACGELDYEWGERGVLAEVVSTRILGKTMRDAIGNK